MRYGFYLPTRGPTATRDGILALAREGERLGFHSAMIADHIVFPVESQSEYPYTVDKKHPGGGDALETFSILGVVAGATERLRLVTSVLVLPYRNPVLTAKMVATLDVLSGGRVTLGVGVGWLKEEFEALDSPDFEHRGAVTDEWLAIFKQLWSTSPATFKGKFYDYADKYLDDGSQTLVPAPLTPSESEQVRALAIRAFTALRCEGLARVDFFYEEGGRGFLLNELNTMPGFTPISMYPKLWIASGLSYRDLIDELVRLAIERHSRRRRNTGC